MKTQQVATSQVTISQRKLRAFLEALKNGLNIKPDESTGKTAIILGVAEQNNNGRWQLTKLGESMIPD